MPPENENVSPASDSPVVTVRVAEKTVITPEEPMASDELTPEEIENAVEILSADQVVEMVDELIGKLVECADRITAMESKLDRCCQHLGI